MNNKNTITRKFIEDNIKVNATVRSYPLRVVTPNITLDKINSRLVTEDETAIVHTINS